MFQKFLLGGFLLGVISCSGKSCSGSMVVGGNSPGGKTNPSDGGTSKGTNGGGGGVYPDTQFFGVDGGQFVLDGGSLGNGNGVTLNAEGHLVINAASIEFHYMWLANSANGWVSKYDTRTAKEVGRYFSVIPKDCSNSEGPPCAGGALVDLRGDRGNSPSRTAVDLYGDVWVANRANGIQGSITKIANSEADCIDRNGDGIIKTSRDLNNDGRISTSPLDGEMIRPGDWSDPNQYDECVLFSTPIGGVAPDVAGRAVAISVGDNSSGDVWYGHYREHRVYKLNPRNGQIVPVNATGAMYIDLTGFDGPYGASIDSQQRLWLVTYPGNVKLALIDTKTGTLVSNNLAPPAGMLCSSYGVTVDGKDRVWVPGLNAGLIACRYDHGPGTSSQVGTWTKFDFSAARTPGGANLGRPRGIAADDSGNIYMASDYDSQNIARVIRFDAETGAVKPFNGNIEIVDATDAETSVSVGMSLDSDGHPWISNALNAMRIHKDSGAILRTAAQPANLYTYSDFTGYQLRKFTSPRGTYSRDFEGCQKARWLTLVWDAVVPPQSTLSAYVRVADTSTALAAAPRYGPFTTSPTDLAAAQVPSGSFIRVEFVLTNTDGKSSPVLRSFQLTSSTCGFE